jgi:hypothetical protein
MQQDQKTGGPVGQVGNWVLIAFFFYCPRVEMSLRCKQMFPGKKCLLNQLSPFGTSCIPLFKCPLSMIALTALRDREDEVYSMSVFSLWGMMKGPAASRLTRRGVIRELLFHLNQGHRGISSSMDSKQEETNSTSQF